MVRCSGCMMVAMFDEDLESRYIWICGVWCVIIRYGDVVVVDWSGVRVSGVRGMVAIFDDEFKSRS
jgi:hypothetical protein